MIPPPPFENSFWWHFYQNIQIDLLNSHLTAHSEQKLGQNLANNLLKKLNHKKWKKKPWAQWAASDSAREWLSYLVMDTPEDEVPDDEGEGGGDEGGANEGGEGGANEGGEGGEGGEGEGVVEGADAPVEEVEDELPGGGGGEVPDGSPVGVARAQTRQRTPSPVEFGRAEPMVPAVPRKRAAAVAAESAWSTSESENEHAKRQRLQRNKPAAQRQERGRGRAHGARGRGRGHSLHLQPGQGGGGGELTSDDFEQGARSRSVSPLAPGLWFPVADPPEEEMLEEADESKSEKEVEEEEEESKSEDKSSSDGYEIDDSTDTDYENDEAAKLGLKKSRKLTQKRKFTRTFKLRQEEDEAYQGGDEDDQLHLPRKNRRRGAGRRKYATLSERRVCNTQLFIFNQLICHVSAFMTRFLYESFFAVANSSGSTRWTSTAAGRTSSTRTSGSPTPGGWSTTSPTWCW